METSELTDRISRRFNEDICEYVIYRVRGRDVRHPGISDTAELESD